MNESCPFCAVSDDDIVAHNATSIALRDAYPLAEGHTLVVPRRHVASIYELDVAEQAELWRLVSNVRSDLHVQFCPDGFNIGVNDGDAAGQTVPHAHIHVIPRHQGDVGDPRGGVRWIIPGKAVYWEDPS